MLTTNAIAKEAGRAAQTLLGADIVRSVEVRDIADEDGEAALRVDFVVSDFDPQVLTFAKRSELAREIIQYLRKNGDTRFPFAHFATEREMAETAASDD